MEYKIEKNEDVNIDVVIPWIEAEEKFEILLNEAVKNVSVKGFRKGAVPRDVALGRVNRAQILADATDQLLRKHYTDIMAKEMLKVIGAPRVSVTKLAEGNDIEIKIVVAVLPDIVLPKKWKDVIKKVNKESAKDVKTISDADVQEEIAHIANSRAQHKEVERAAQKDDHVKIDFTVKQDGVIIENGTSKDHSLVLGKGVFIPGFEEEVIGMKKGEEKTFTLKFPADYHAKNLAGKDATFEVKLNVVEERITPEITDAFAVSLGAQFATVDDLKKSVKEGMEKEKEKKMQEEKRAKYLDALADTIDVVLPEMIIHEELHRMLGEFEQQLSMSGMQLDMYLEKIGKTKDDVEKEWEPQAKKRVLSALVLEQLAEDEEVNIDSKEIEEEMNKTLAMYKGVQDLGKNLDMRQLYEYTRGMMRNEKVFEILEKI
ncbi:MAG: trigger factor [Parcubacteria group bacterium]|jgi:trigger factor